MYSASCYYYSKTLTSRTFLAHGADVLLVTSPNLPDLPSLDVDTSRGKRTTQLDLNNDSDKRTLTELASTCDVFLQSYRPGALAARNFGPADLAKARPGIVYASLCAWGWEGPWKDRRGVSRVCWVPQVMVQTRKGYRSSSTPLCRPRLASTPLKAKHSCPRTKGRNGSLDRFRYRRWTTLQGICWPLGSTLCYVRRSR